MQFSVNFYVIGSWVSGEPLSQISYPEQQLPSLPLLIHLILFFSRDFNTIWKYIICLVARCFCLTADSTWHPGALDKYLPISGMNE